MQKTKKEVSFEIGKLFADKLKNLNLIQGENDEIYQGIGHNRWATHGIKNDINAHPHLSNDLKFAIVHNGIIENYADLKKILIDNEYIFHSQTDTEVIVNLVSYYYNIYYDTFKALDMAIHKIQGTYGIILLDVNSPDKIFCVRNGSPLLIGRNEDCVIITSEQSGFCNLISNYITLQNDDICIIKRADDKKHKYEAVVDDHKVKFGAIGYDDYTTTHDKDKMISYTQRHEKEKNNWSYTHANLLKPSFWAKNLLWND